VALSKKQKMLLSKSIVNDVRSQNPPGRFLQKDSKTEMWYDVGDQRAREKTSQALREGAPDIRKVPGAASDPAACVSSAVAVTPGAGTGTGTNDEMPPPPPPPPPPEAKDKEVIESRSSDDNTNDETPSDESSKDTTLATPSSFTTSPLKSSSSSASNTQKPRGDVSTPSFDSASNKENHEPHGFPSTHPTGQTPTPYPPLTTTSSFTTSPLKSSSSSSTSSFTTSPLKSSSSSTSGSAEPGTGTGTGTAGTDGTEELHGQEAMTSVTDSDVLCGRGGATFWHPGNQTYRRLVNLNKGLYITCLKTEKLKISRSIVAAIREQRGRFLEKNKDGMWYDIGDDKKAIEKTSQALREGQPKLRQKIVSSGNNDMMPPPAQQKELQLLQQKELQLLQQKELLHLPPSPLRQGQGNKVCRKRAHNDIAVTNKMKRRSDKESKRRSDKRRSDRAISSEVAAAAMPKGVRRTQLPFALINHPDAVNQSDLLDPRWCSDHGTVCPPILHASRHAPENLKPFGPHYLEPYLHGGEFVVEKNGPDYTPDIYGTSSYTDLVLFLELNHDRKWISGLRDKGTPIYVYVIERDNEDYECFRVCTIGGLDIRWYAKSETSIYPDKCYKATRLQDGELIWELYWERVRTAEAV
jgi:hypothetical protein